MDFISQLATQSKVVTVGKSLHPQDFNANIIIGDNAEPQMGEIMYDFKVLAREAVREGANDY